MVDQYRDIYTLTGHSSPTDLLTLADGQAVFAAKSAVAVTPQQYGAKADGVTDDSAAFVAAIAALKAYALNTGGGGFYKGSPKLFIPAGHYYLGTTAIDVNHSLVIEGEGSGQFGPGAHGCSHLRWAAGTSGLRIQHPNTNGDTGVDTNPNTHDGSGTAILRGLCLEGGYAGTEGEFHGLVIRHSAKADDLYIINWQGEGVKGWTGTVIGYGGGSLGGDVSGSVLIGVKTEGCRGGFDFRGTDSNVLTFISCNAYQNRQFGFVDDNGAGSNTYIGCHTASNGVVTGTWPQTQCSYSGRRKALKWGGDPTVAPSTDTSDTANWLDIEPGAAITNLIPAWVNTAGTFRQGGDYVTLNSAGVHLVNCYSEYGGFNQFSSGTLIENGTIGDQYSRGGVRYNPTVDGFKIRQSPNCGLVLQHRGTNATIFAIDELGVQHSLITLDKTAGNYYYARDANGHNFYTAPYGGSWTFRGRIGINGLELPSGHVVQVNNTQVVGARQTGTPADATDLATALTLVNALKAKLITHGLIS